MFGTVNPAAQDLGGALSRSVKPEVAYGHIHFPRLPLAVSADLYSQSRDGRAGTLIKVPAILRLSSGVTVALVSSPPAARPAGAIY